MTPLRRDRNLVRVRRLTSVVAGGALAATGLFAGLAASKGKGTTKAVAVATSAKQTTKAVQTTSAAQTTTQQTQTTSVVVLPTQQTPVASSGGS
jgi:hypothetical protein